MASSSSKCLVEKTNVCLEHTFNGAIVGILDAYSPSNAVTPSTVAFVVNTPNPKFLMVFRNSETAGGSTCNISYKHVDKEGKLVPNMPYDHIVIDDFKEDPRLFLLNGALHMSYNKVHVQEDGKIKNVRVHFSRLGDRLRFQEELTHSYIKCMHWEKNWMFFEHHGSPHIFYSLYPYTVIDGGGQIIKVQEWLHPRDKERQIEQFTHFHMTRDFRRLMRATSSRDMFYAERWTFDIRGGAAPVLLNGIYYLFAHVREMPGAKYRLLVVLVDAASLDLLGFTYPLDIGVDEDTRIIYPSGAVYNIFDDTWYISCGVDDKDLVLLKVTNEFLSEKIIYFDVSKHGLA